MNTTDLKKALRKAVSSGDTQTAIMIEQELDKQYGKNYAPAGVRARVGNAKTPEDRLSTLQKIYPDAQPYGDNNFRYTDNGVPTTYNEKGLTLADLAEYGRAPAEMLGGAIAAVPTMGVAAPFSGPAALIPGVAAYGVGSEIAGQGYDMLMGADDSRSLWDQLKSGLYNVAASSTGGPTKAASKVSSKAISKDAVENAATRSGVKLSLADLTGSKPAQTMENMLGATPFGGAVIRQGREDAADALAGSVSGATKNAFVSPLQGGGAIVDDAVGFANDRRNQVSDAYDAVKDTFAAKGNTPMSGITTPNVKALADETTLLKQQAGEFADIVTEKPLDKIIKVAAKTDKQLMPYEALAKYRTAVGSDLNNFGLVKKGNEQGALKRIYGAQSKDLDLAAEQLGGLPGAAARDKANTLARDVNNQLEFLEKSLGIKNAGKDAAQRAVEVNKKTTDAFLSNPSKMSAIVESMTPETLEAFLDTQIRAMGRATAGAQDATGEVFSASTFVTNWNKLIQKAPENIALFSEAQLAKIKDTLKVSSVLKDTARHGTNFSGTGAAMQTATTALSGILGYQLGGAEGALGMAAGGLLAPQLLAKGMYSPKVHDAYKALDRAGLLDMGNAAATLRKPVAAEAGN